MDGSNTITIKCAPALSPSPSLSLSFSLSLSVSVCVFSLTQEFRQLQVTLMTAFVFSHLHQKAAMNMQRIARGHAVRRDQRVLAKNASVIQKYARGRKVRVGSPHALAEHMRLSHTNLLGKYHWWSIYYALLVLSTQNAGREHSHEKQILIQTSSLFSVCCLHDHL